MGNQTGVTDGADNTTSYEYDGLNRLIRETNQLQASRTYNYDANGNRLTATDRDGRVRTFEYDHLNRQIKENWLEDGNPAPVYTALMAYDAAGELISASDNNSVYSYGYDRLGRLISVDNLDTPGAPHVTLVNGYDANSNRTSVVATIDGAQDYRQDFVYDHLNRQTSVHQYAQAGNDVSDKRVVFAYDLAGQWSTITRYAGAQQVATSTYTYDEDGRLRFLSHYPVNDAAVNYVWVYDGANRITGALDHGQTPAYEYDLAGQLISAEDSYDYDGNGNRSVAMGYTTGLDNRVTSDGIYNYNYDDEGNLVLRSEVAQAGNVRVLAYDYRNRLIEVKDYTGYVNSSNAGTLVMEAQYTYDVFNLRIAKTVDDDGNGSHSAVVTRWVLDGQHEVLQFAGTTLSHRYLFGPQIDQILADEALGEASSTIWILPDNLGSVRDTVDSSGHHLDRIDYDAFGQPLDAFGQPLGAVPMQFGYTGRDWDPETGLQYNRARYYDATIGRWIGQDPIGLTVDANPYRYVGNSPTNWVDPNGLYQVNFWASLVDPPWTPGQMMRVKTAFGHVKARLPFLINEANQELSNLSDCEKKKLGPWLNDFKAALGEMQTRLDGSSTLYVYHYSMGPQGPLAKSWPPGGSSIYSDRIYLNDSGTTNWLTMSDGAFDRLIFHELLHLASAKMLDQDAPSDLYNAEFISDMVSKGIAGNAYYKEAKQKAIDECQCQP